MKIIYSPKFLPEYDNTPAGSRGRLEPALAILQKDSNNLFIEPNLPTEEDIARAHSKSHIDGIKGGGGGGSQNVYEIALLAAGGAIQAADIAAEGDPAFAFIRPPGHHASRDSCWGFCYFSNVALSLLHLRAKGSIKRAYILDFDLHTGDGTIDILGGMEDYEILNPLGSSEADYLSLVEESLSLARPCDIIVASAGFDQGSNDWGRLLTPESFRKIGEMMRAFALKKCGGRRYAVLEGGYNFPELAKNIKAFCEGFR